LTGAPAGTWKTKPEDVVKAVEYAIKEAGYRHIDCAWGYRNEKSVGEGIRNAGVPRSGLFVSLSDHNIWV